MKKQRIIVYLKNTGLIIGSFLLFAVFFNCKQFVSKGQVYSSKNINDFYENGIVFNPKIDRYIEEDYFAKNTLYNGDFSQGLHHWALGRTSGAFFNPLKNKLEISFKEYRSAPCALKVNVAEYPCRLFYVDDADMKVVNYLSDIKRSRIWLGVKPNEQLIMSAYYKGAGLTLIIGILDIAGEQYSLKTQDFPAADDLWAKAWIQVDIPREGRAICLEIKAVPSFLEKKILLLDDIKIEMLKNAPTQ